MWLPPTSRIHEPTRLRGKADGTLAKSRAGRSRQQLVASVKSPRKDVLSRRHDARGSHQFSNVIIGGLAAHQSSEACFRCPAENSRRTYFLAQGRESYAIDRLRLTRAETRPLSISSDSTTVTENGLHGTFPYRSERGLGHVAPSPSHAGKTLLLQRRLLSACSKRRRAEV